MKYILVAVFLFFPPFVQAYNPVAVTVDQPFDEILIPMEGEAQKQSYLGTLETYPHLYEFSLSEVSTLVFRTRQLEQIDAEPINLILVSVDPETEQIREVVRSNAPISERSIIYDKPLAISFYESDWLETKLEPGLYRLEVSTPRNESSYELDFGRDSVNGGYFGTFGSIWQAQHHFGYSWTRLFVSTYFLYQLGIIVLIGAIYYTWRRQKSMKEEISEPLDAA